MRFHDLDALRAVAMLLGILLHAALSFAELPFWPVQDIHQSDAVFGTFYKAIHGFRMPLFFLVSGFFTAMLAQKRGLRALAKHRTKRVVLPLVIGWFVFVIPTFVVIAIGSAKQAASKAGTNATGSTSAESADSGDTLRLATVRGDLDQVLGFLEAGADPNAPDQDGNRPIHIAAFFGYNEIAGRLIEHGADPNAVNNKGDTPVGSARAPWWLTQFIAGMVSIELDRQQVEAGRAEIIELLTAHGAEPPSGPRLSGLVALAAFLPLFVHLWFLYYLLWLVAAYILLAKLARTLKLPKLPDRLMGDPGCLLWLVPLTLLPQAFMNQGFGPDTAAGPVPWPPIFAYYAIFFLFGAACFGRTTFHEKTGRLWPLYLAASVPLYLVGTGTVDTGDHHLVGSLAAATFAWLMIFASIGFFRRVFHGENRHLRYVSDASYWLYLAHLPLVMLLQIIVSDWELPAGVKFLGVCTVTYGSLILIYEYAIRYTWAGALLNGRKVRHGTRPPPLPPGGGKIQKNLQTCNPPRPGPVRTPGGTC